MLRSIIQKIKFFHFLLLHPLNRVNKWGALLRYVYWQIGARLVMGDVLVPFVDKTFLRIRPSMTGATGNIYTGLHEFEDMAFTLHLLRKNDLFVDIGANIGSYTILGAGAVGAHCISVEPVKSTFHQLKENINLNKLSCQIQAMNIGIDKEKGVLQFTTDLDTVNHVLSDFEEVDNVTQTTTVSLNDLLENQAPTLIKIDVEGFETNVITGADKVLSQPSLLAVIMELNGCGKRYGFNEDLLHKRVLSFGFKSYIYSPFQRQLVSLNNKRNYSGNTLYVRNLEEVINRLKESHYYYINNTKTKI